MAKIVLYISAGNDNRASLLATARSFADSDFVISNGLQLAFMTPLASDQLSVPVDSKFVARLDLAIEIMLPHGQPLKPLLEEMKKALEPICSLSDQKNCYVLQGYHRVFKESGPKALRYHYLMYRREDFGRADYLDYYTHHHYQFGIKTPLIDYYQTYISHESTAELADLLGVNAIDAENISEMHLDSMDAFLSTDVMAEIGPAAAEDEARFVDRGNSTSFTMEVIYNSVAA